MDYICIEKLGFAYPKQAAEFSLEKLVIKESEGVAMIGRSGCGKTTLLHLISGILRPLRGTVRIGGEPPLEVAKKGVLGCVFQISNLVPWRTVRQNIELPLDLTSRKGVDGRVKELLETIGLADYADYYPDQLSGGMQGRVALARALVNNPHLLLLDEPFADLDEVTRVRLNKEVALWRQRTGATTITVTHNIVDALSYSDRILVIASPGPEGVTEMLYKDMVLDPSPLHKPSHKVSQYYEPLLQLLEESYAAQQ